MQFPTRWAARFDSEFIARPASISRIGATLLLLTLGFAGPPGNARAAQSHQPPAPTTFGLPGQAAPPGPLYRTGELIIKFEERTSAPERAQVLAELGATPVRTLGGIRAEQVSLAGMDVEEAVRRFKNHPHVAYIEPNYIVHALVVPNDTRMNLLWGLLNTGQNAGTPGADIKATQAWDVTTGSPEVLIGVIDTGVDYTHPDLAANIWTNPREVPDNGVDDDGNGYIDDVHGWDFANESNDPMDDNGHGTHTSGTIGAVGNNALGVAGVNWKVRIMALKFLDARGTGSTAGAIRAIEYATRMGVRLTSNSWSGPAYSQALREAIRAAGDAGILFVAAAGNNGSNTDLFPIYPAAYDEPNIISVAATDGNDQLTFFSNYGPASVDIAAPGLRILSTAWGGGYAFASGTSMAAPHVSGALGLIFARYPRIDAISAKALLLARADRLPQLAGLVVSGGRLNAFLSVAGTDTVPPGGIIDVRAEQVHGASIRLAWTATGDDGAAGTVARYDLRISTAPITAENFTSARRLDGPLFPAVSGATDHVEVPGLAFSTTYFLAVQAVDELGNRGSISNVLSVVTLPPPDIAVDVTPLATRLFTGQKDARVLTVTNQGPSELHFDVSLRSVKGGALHAARILRAHAARGRGAAPPIGAASPPRDGPYTPDGAPPHPRLAPGAPIIPGVLAARPLRVLILHSRADVSEIRSLLQSYPDLAAVDVWDGTVIPPSLADLIDYDVVIAATNAPFADPVSVGDALADFADAGGGLILTLATFVDGFQIKGRLGAEGYIPFDHGSGPTDGSTLGAFDAAHPIMQGVSAATGDALGVATLSPGSELVASWSNGAPLVATKFDNVAAVNVFIARPGYFTGDIPLLLHNAVVWSGHLAAWVSSAPARAVVPAGGSVDLAVRFDAEGLAGGDYDGNLIVTSDDPDEARVEIPAHLHVTDAADLRVSGEHVTVESQRPYLELGASTLHWLQSSIPPGGVGSLELLVDGDYSDPQEFATLSVEDSVLGRVGETRADCFTGRRSFALDVGYLSRLLADGHLVARVENSAHVQALCPENKHTVRLRYAAPLDPLAFGSVFVGANGERVLEVTNRGSVPLSITSISSDQAAFTPSVASMTVPPDSTQALHVRFSAQHAGSFTGALSLASNDPDAPVFTVRTTASAVVPPIADVKPKSIAATLPEHGTDDRVLHLLNRGSSPLEFSVRVLGRAPGSVVTSFAGLSTAARTEAGRAANPAGESSRSDVQPRLTGAEAAFDSLRASPDRLTAVVEDEVAGFLYAQEIDGAHFYRYRADLDQWDRLADAPIQAHKRGSAALLGGTIYTAYAQNDTVLGVYTIATDTWTTLTGPLFGQGVAPKVVTSDGIRYLYFALGYLFRRFEPGTGLITDLATPPISFDYYAGGGLRWFDGVIYGHQGRGQTGFARYDVASNSWTLLPPLPIGAVQGAAIDRAAREYVAYGPQLGSDLLRFSIDSGTWSISTNPFFSVLDGGMGWLPSPVPGVLFVQGAEGIGLARLVSSPGFVEVAPSIGSVPAGGSLTLGVHVDAGSLLGAAYRADIAIATNDPAHATILVPAALSVIGAPRIALRPRAVTLESAKSYTRSGDLTFHMLRLPLPTHGGATLELVADGDYAALGETATLIAEGIPFGSVGPVGDACLPASGTFAVSPAQLARLSADGIVRVAVQNGRTVGTFCPLNRHTVRLRYAPSVDRLDFGTPFAGRGVDFDMEIENAGSVPLVIRSIATDRREFVPDRSALTVPARSARVLRIRFTAPSPGPRQGTLWIESNDAVTPLLRVPLTGTGVEPPEIAAQPQALSATLGAHQTATRELTIGNIGRSLLDFEIAVRLAAPGAVTSPFAGLSPGRRSESPPTEVPSPSLTPGIAQTEAREPLFRATSAEFQDLAPSPGPMTCVVEDPDAGLLFAHQSFSSAFYRYEAAANAWQRLANGPYLVIKGGGALLRGKVYMSYLNAPGSFAVYDIASNTWSSLPRSIPLSTGNITSDGSRSLYLAAGSTFLRVDPATGETDSLASPPFLFERWGGLEYFEGRVYGHSGNDSGGFAQYDVAARAWTRLPAMPAGAVLGSTIDPILREYVAVGPFNGTNVFRFSIATGEWSVATNPFFQVGDGGVGWLSSPLPGVCFAQGELGIGFARMLGAPAFVTVSPTHGTVHPGASARVEVRFDSQDLIDGTYRAELAVASNDPLVPALAIPATLGVGTEPPSIHATLDLHPGTLDPGVQGRWFTAFLELPAPYSAAQVDFASVRLGDAVAPDPGHHPVGDRDGDSILDLKLRFDRASVVERLPEADSVDIVVTGRLVSGRSFVGVDRVRFKRHRVVAPNGGERLVARTPVTIRWTVPRRWEVVDATVLYSLDDGAQWTVLAEKVKGNEFVWALPDRLTTAARVRVSLFDKEGLIANDSSDGPFSIVRSAPEGTGTEGVPPAFFALRPNAPNPFRVATRIGFDLPVGSHVRLRVFDAAGRIVRTLIDRDYGPGHHEIEWDGRDGAGQRLHAGVYFYKIVADRFSAIRRTVLLD